MKSLYNLQPAHTDFSISTLGNPPSRCASLILAAQFAAALLLLATTTQAQIAIHDGPLTVTHASGYTINQSFTATAGATVMVVCLEDRGASLTEPATLAWNGQTLTRDIQTAYTVGNARSLAIYHLFNPAAGTANITGTLGSAVSDQWVTAYTLKGVDTTVAPVPGSANTDGNTAGVTSLSINLTDLAGSAWAAVSSEFANNAGVANVTGTAGTATTASDTNDATTAVTAGYVAGLGAGTDTLAEGWVPDGTTGPQKSNFAIDVFTPTNAPPAQLSTSLAFGLKFLGNTTDTVTNRAGVFPISGWNNIANATFTSGVVYSSDGSISATLTRSRPGMADTWSSGALSDGGNGSLMDGYSDPHQGNPATNVISGLTGPAYDLYLYTGGDVARPSQASDYLPNYTVNGTIYYTATLKGYDAMLKMVQSVPTAQNSDAYPTTLAAGQYLKISAVVPVNGAITIGNNADSLTYRSPLNGIELVLYTNAPQIMGQPSPHRLYTSGVAQLQVQAEGASPLTYFWCQNGVSLNDSETINGSKTSSLTISNLALTNAGNYTVVVTNSYGSVTSQVANLNVVVESQADAALEDWLAAYLVTTNGYQTYIVNSLDNRNFAFMWQQAFMIWMVEDACNRTQSPDQRQLINHLLNTFIHQNGTTLTWDGWDDDLEWGIIALVKGYQITGNVAALNSAIYNWNAVWSRGWDDVYGGGIWEQLPAPTSKCTLSNCPFIIGGMALYQITGQASYLATCETVYAWTRTNLFIATPAEATNGMNLGQVNEGIAWADTNDTTEKVLVSNNSYNNGLFATATTLLYQATGNSQYLSDAILAVNEKVNAEPIVNEDHVANGDFGAEQLLRGVVLIASQNQNNLWPTYWPWLETQCTAAWNERRTDYNLTQNNWTEITSAGTNDLDSMESECASLVQQVTPAAIPGFVNDTNKLSGKIIGTSGSWSNDGDTIANVFDGNLNTFFDGPDATGDWVGLDFGVGVSNVIGQINYWPRISFPSRMLGGVFQGDNTPTFPNPVTLFTVTVTPPASGLVSAQPITNQMAFRCVRYVGPANGNCNLAELQFFSPNLSPLPLSPRFTGVSLSGTTLSVSATNGTPGGSWILLQSTNLALPLNQWETNLTGAFDASGNLSTNISSPAANPQQFYLFKVQ